MSSFYLNPLAEHQQLVVLVPNNRHLVLVVAGQNDLKLNWKFVFQRLSNLASSLEGSSFSD